MSAVPATLPDLVLHTVTQLNADDAVPLRQIIATAWVHAYEQIIASELAKATGSSRNYVRLTNPVVRNRIEQQAAQTVAGMAQTFQADVARFLASQPAAQSETETANALAAYLTQRDTWKSVQVALTEVQQARGAALRDFVQHSGAQGTASFGGSLSCLLCQSVAAYNPYDLNDPMVGSYPHPGCKDEWSTSVEAIDRPWTGG